MKTQIMVLMALLLALFLPVTRAQRIGATEYVRYIRNIEPRDICILLLIWVLVFHRPLAARINRTRKNIKSWCYKRKYHEYVTRTRKLMLSGSKENAAATHKSSAIAKMLIGKENDAAIRGVSDVAEYLASLKKGTPIDMEENKLALKRISAVAKMLNSRKGAEAAMDNASDVAECLATLRVKKTADMEENKLALKRISDVATFLPTLEPVSVRSERSLQSKEIASGARAIRTFPNPTIQLQPELLKIKWVRKIWKRVARNV